MLNVRDISRINEQHETYGLDQFTVVLIDNNSWLKVVRVTVEADEDTHELYYRIVLTEVNKTLGDTEISSHQIGL